MKHEDKKNKRLKRKLRIRSTISGTAEVPRITVSRSNKYFYAQAIDDEAKKTIYGVKSKANANTEEVGKLGEEFAKELIKGEINRVKFDRNGYAYHGKVSSFADGLRKGKIEL